MSDFIGLRSAAEAMKPEEEGKWTAIFSQLVDTWLNMPLGGTAKVQSCLRRIRSWPVPPNWSLTDWLEEVSAVAASAACEAEHEFDVTRGVPLCVFVCSRMLNRALTRYRQEWAFFVSCGCERADEVERHKPCRAEARLTVVGESNPICDALMERVAGLSVQHRLLIERLFWLEWSEARIGRALEISQRAVSKRKQLLIGQLQQWLNPPQKNSADQVLKSDRCCNNCMRANEGIKNATTKRLPRPFSTRWNSPAHDQRSNDTIT